MWSFILRRLLQLVPVLLGITLISFVLMYVVPGDPAYVLAPRRLSEETRRALHRQWNLDKPLPIQYVLFLGRIATGDLGYSFQRRSVAVSEILWEGFKNTAILAAVGMALAVVFGMLAGVVSAARPRGIADYTAMILALVGVSTPAFWLGMILIDVFSMRLGWFAAAASVPLTAADLVLPAVTLAAVSMGPIARLTRASMLEVLGQDYIRTARAKGLAGWVVLYRHALRNALVPIITLIGANFSYLLSGAVLTETVFSWPGLGSALFDAIRNRDQPVVMAGVVYMAVIFVLANLVIDLLYAVIDPRIRHGEGHE